MYCYIISEGKHEIEHIFFGATKDEVVEKARPMINEWWEYKAMNNEEIIDFAENNETEFDLVKIKGKLPKEDISKEELVIIYNSRHNG